VHRILTEAKNVEGVKRLLIRLGLDYTVLLAEGSYQGAQERSLVIELVNARRELVFTAAKQIKDLNTQDAVLVQEIPVVSKMV
jgi:hypothetical protein